MDDSVSEAAATMEKLELLSATALLKQGIDGATGTFPHEDHQDGKVKNRNLETPMFGHATTTNTNLPSCENSPSSVASTMPKPIFSVASTASVTGLLMQEVSSPGAVLASNCKAATSHLASPVSADGDEEVHSNGNSARASSAGRKIATPLNNTLNASFSTHSLQQLIESRSPVASVEYHRHQVVEASTPPSSASYGYPLHPRYDSTSTVFRPPMENSAFTVFGGAANTDNLAGTARDACYYQQRQLPSPHQLSSPKDSSLGGGGGKKFLHQPFGSSYEEAIRELAVMREQLKEKDLLVSSLQYRVDYLENKINELRQLPTGKISHIPVE
jgi:hypothetical protein